MLNKRIFQLMVCVCLLTAVFTLSFTIKGAPSQSSEVIFRTPEEAITAYVEGVAQGDIQKILYACAINEMSENFRFDLYIERLRAFLPWISLAPSNYPFYVELNKVELSSQISGQVKILAFGLLSTEPVGEGKTIMMDMDGANNFIKAVDPARLASLEVKMIVLPNEAIMSSPRHLENTAKTARVYGADEVTERLALVTFEQNYYALGFTLLRYGESWKISSQTSALGNTSATGAPLRITPEEFEKLVGQKP